MKTSSLVLAAVLAFGSGASMAATGPLDLSTGNTGFSNSPVIGTFTDVYTFTVVSPVFANGSVTTAVNVSQNIDFSAMVLTGPGNATYSFTKLLGDPVEVWSLSTTTLAAGAYTLTLTGLNSPSGASYGGNFAVTPVPEPESLALLLGGLGVVGFVARRRRG